MREIARRDDVKIQYIQFIENSLKNGGTEIKIIVVIKRLQQKIENKNKAKDYEKNEKTQKRFKF